MHAPRANWSLICWLRIRSQPILGANTPTISTLCVIKRAQTTSTAGYVSVRYLEILSCVANKKDDNKISKIPKSGWVDLFKKEKDFQ